MMRTVTLEAIAGAVGGLATGYVLWLLAISLGDNATAGQWGPLVLLASVVLIQSSLLKQVSEVAPKTAPALVFTEIAGDQAPAFDAAVSAAFGRPLDSSMYLRAPFITGRIVRVRGAPIDPKSVKQSERWAYDNDISMSALGPRPADAGIVAGRWWPADYAGTPLLAMDADVAGGANIKVGDAVTISVLGREIETRVAVLRKVDFGGFGVNFSMILTPSAFEGATLRQVAIAKASQKKTISTENRRMTVLIRTCPGSR